MKKISRSIAVLALCFVMLSGECAGFLPYAHAGEPKISAVIELNDDVQLEELDTKELNDTKVIVVSEDLEEQDKDLLEKVMDNGTGIIVEGVSVEEVQDYFGVDAAPESENMLACYVAKNGSDTVMIPIEAKIMCKKHPHITVSAADYEELLSAVSLNYEQIAEDCDQLNDTVPDKSADLEEDLGAPFCQAKKLVYLYADTSSNAIKSFFRSIFGSKDDMTKSYTRIGAVNFLIMAKRIMTRDGATYDEVLTTTAVTGSEAYQVNEFYTHIAVSDSKTEQVTSDENWLLDFTYPENEDQRVEVTYGVLFGFLKYKKSEKHICDPTKMEILPKIEEENARWACTPNDPTTATTWSYSPAIILKKTNGTKKAVTASTYVSEINVGGYSSEQVGCCKINFKNHKEVS